METLRIKPIPPPNVIWKSGQPPRPKHFPIKLHWSKKWPLKFRDLYNKVLNYFKKWILSVDDLHNHRPTKDD